MGAKFATRVAGLEHYGSTDQGVGRDSRGDLDAVRAMFAAHPGRIAALVLAASLTEPARILRAFATAF